MTLVTQFVYGDPPALKSDMRCVVAARAYHSYEEDASIEEANKGDIELAMSSGWYYRVKSESKGNEEGDAEIFPCWFPESSLSFNADSDDEDSQDVSEEENQDDSDEDSEGDNEDDSQDDSEEES